MPRQGQTRRQRRSADRIARARGRKSDRFRRFVKKLVDRKYGRDRHVVWDFCCWPSELGMSPAEFLAKGEQLAGGQAVFYPEGDMAELLHSSWRCSEKGRPHVVFASRLAEVYDEDGHYR